MIKITYLNEIQVDSRLYLKGWVMYCERSVKPLVTNKMKRIAWFLIVMCAMSCCSAYASITVVDASGDVGGSSTVGGSWEDPVIVSYRETGIISPPLSGSLSWDLDKDGTDDLFAGTEIGFWYIEGYVVTPDPLIGVETGGHGVAFFKIDSSQLLLNWNVETNGYSPGPFPMCWLSLEDWTSGTDILYRYYYPGYNPDDWFEGTQIVSLDPSHTYRLQWHLELDVSGAGWGPTDAWARFTLDLEDHGGSRGGNDKIVETIAFFDDSVDAGVLEGQGPARSADNRLNALRNMLETAAVLIEGGFYQEARDQLWDAYGKCDGEATPTDLVMGDATADLAERILDVIDGLGWE